LDGSDNVGKNNFPYVRDFVTNLVNSLDVGSDNIRVGLVQFSDTPVTEFSLDTYQTKSELLAHLRRLQLKGGSGLNAGSALSYIHANHFTEAGGSRTREHVPQLLLLLMAGPSEDAYLQAANALVRSGVLTFCVGTNRADKAELEHIAFNPSLVYLMDDFRSLPSLPQQLIQPLTTYVSGGVQEVPLSQPGKPPSSVGPFPSPDASLAAVAKGTSEPVTCGRMVGSFGLGLVKDSVLANVDPKCRTFSYALFMMMSHIY
jgi:collagen type VI alpha